MRTFYTSSHWFWVISRILFVLMFGISIAQIMGEEPLRGGEEVFVNGVCVVGALVLAVLVIIELARGAKPAWLRIAGGTFLVFCGLGLLVVLAMGMVSGGLVLLLLLFIAWFLLAGIRDFVVH